MTFDLVHSYGTERIGGDGPRPSTPILHAVWIQTDRETDSGKLRTPNPLLKQVPSRKLISKCVYTIIFSASLDTELGKCHSISIV